MPSRSTQPPAPLPLHKPKSKRSLRSFFLRSPTAEPISPPATPESFSSLDTIDSQKTPRPILRPSLSKLPTHFFPQGVYDCIFEQLLLIYSQNNNATPCDTCLMRDLCALALTGKSWYEGFIIHLYRKIYLHGSDSHTQLKRRFGLNSSNAYGARIKRLCRTLHSRPDLAAMVLELKVPAYDQSLPREDIIYIHSVVANLVLECPNLERLVGFYPTYEFGCSGDEDETIRRSAYRWGGGDKLWQALSTRTKLKEHVWLLSGEALNPPEDREHFEADGVGQYYDPHAQERQLPIDIIDRFLWYHRSWTELETLVLHGMASEPSLSHGDFDVLFQMTPNITSLFMSHFHPHHFSDQNLDGLPSSITSLRLESMPGLTDRGLSNYFSSRGKPIKKLSLINLEIQSLLLVVKIFANLTDLEHFTLLQNESPQIPPGEMIFLRPLMVNHSLKFLHWDCLNASATDGVAESHLASSINEGGFLRLARLRAPSDPNGILQSVCKPKETVEQPGDKFRSLIVKQTPQRTRQAAAGYAPTSPDLGMSPPFSPTQGTSPNSQFLRHLPTARAAAQMRLELAKNPAYSFPTKIMEMTDTQFERASIPAFQIRILVTNYDLGGAQEAETVVGFIGNMESKVDYWMYPDIPGAESAVVGIGDIIDLGWEWRANGVANGESCTGLANLREGPASGGHPKKYFLHTERVRWKKIPLSLLF